QNRGRRRFDGISENNLNLGEPAAHLFFGGNNRGWEQRILGPAHSLAQRAAARMLVVLKHAQMIGVEQDHFPFRRRLLLRRRARCRSCARIFRPAASISFMSSFPENMPTVRFQSFTRPAAPRPWASSATVRSRAAIRSSTFACDIKTSF